MIAVLLAAIVMCAVFVLADMFAHLAGLDTRTWVDDEPIDYDLTALADAAGVLVDGDDGLGGAA